MSNIVRLGERRAKRMQEEIEIEEENSEEDNNYNIKLLQQINYNNILQHC